MSKKLIKVQRTGTSFDLKVAENIAENTSQNINTQTVNVIYDAKVIEKSSQNDVLTIKKVDFKDEIIRVFKDIILEDKKAIINVLDQSGCIIVPIKDLFALISCLYEVDESHIKINLEDAEAGCWGKITQTKTINSIKLRTDSVYRDLASVDNGKYNQIIDEFKVSLTRVFVQ
jgi:hypothetical protein